MARGNLRFSPGLLSQIGNFGQGLTTQQGAASSSMLPPAQQFGPSGLGGMFARNLGGLLGKDMRSSQEKITQGMAEIDPSDPQRMAKMYGLIIEHSTDPNQKIAAMGKMQELAQNQQKLQQVQRYRDSLIANADQAGLGELTPQIVNANETQLKELAKTIGERQVKLASRGDDDLATVRYMQARGVSKPDLQAQYGQDLSKMPSLEEMVKIADAEDQGDIKADGTVEYKYVNATEAGLSPAPNVIQNMTDETKIGDFLIEGEATRFLEGYDKAQTATETLALARQAQSLLEYANTGIFSGVKTNFQRVAEMLGAPESVTASAAASEAYFSNRGREFAKFVKNFGTGNSITEKDVQIAKEITGGEGTLSRRALEQILKDSIAIAEGLIGNHNTKVDRYVQRKIPEASQFVLDTPPDLTFSPEDFGIVTPPQKSTAEYIEEAQRLNEGKP
jgi:hypothetical protein